MAELSRHHKRAIDIIIPYQPTDQWRAQALQFVQKRYQKQLPNARIFVQRDNSTEFNKCRAVNNAARKGNGRILMICDADCFLKSKTLAQALDRLVERGNHYVYPYTHVDRIGKAKTREYLQEKPTVPPFHATTDLKKSHVDTGGVILVTRTAFEAVRGMDERFHSVYGAESVSFTNSIKRLFKPVTRIQARLYHLWHPKFKRAGHPKQKANRALQKRYCKNHINDLHQVISEKKPIK